MVLAQSFGFGSAQPLVEQHRNDLNSYKWVDGLDWILLVHLEHLELPIMQHLEHLELPTMLVVLGPSSHSNHGPGDPEQCEHEHFAGLPEQGVHHQTAGGT